MQFGNTRHGNQVSRGVAGWALLDCQFPITNWWVRHGASRKSAIGIWQSKGPPFVRKRADEES
jgi:hypothetical protein